MKSKASAVTLGLCFTSKLTIWAWAEDTAQWEKKWNVSSSHPIPFIYNLPNFIMLQKKLLALLYLNYSESNKLLFIIQVISYMEPVVSSNNCYSHIIV